MFQHNAWDDVEWPEEMQQKALEIVKNQKENKLGEEKAAELLGQPERQWDAFYRTQSNKFFKDRQVEKFRKEIPGFILTNDILFYSSGSSRSFRNWIRGIQETKGYVLPLKLDFLYSADQNHIVNGRLLDTR